MSLTYKIRECPPERTRIMTNEEVTPNPLWNEKTTQWGAYFTGTRPTRQTRLLDCNPSASFKVVYMQLLFEQQPVET